MLNEGMVARPKIIMNTEAFKEEYIKTDAARAMYTIPQGINPLATPR